MRSIIIYLVYIFFFFQAEDGIRDYKVTGVQTCALPIYVLQDEKDENVYYFFEVYTDQAALDAHRTMPHYAVWRGAAETLDGPTEATRCKTVFPAARGYWVKR